MAWRAELEQNLRDERRFFLRLAYSQLREQQDAADVVQEMSLAAWQAIDQFEGRATIRTWLVGILRFKILDALRRRKRQPSFKGMDVDQELQMLDGALFDVNGRWVDEPQAWWETDSNPSETLQQKQTMQLLQACLEKLPEKTAHVFLMREYLGFESQEISHRTGLQMNHIRVIMMRARLALRTCLEFKMAGRPGLKE